MTEDKLGFDTCDLIDKKLDNMRLDLSGLQGMRPIDDLDYNAHHIYSIIGESKRLALILLHHVMIGATDVQVLDEALVSARDLAHESNALVDAMELKLKTLKTRS